MRTEQPKGPFCQSCAMPLEHPEDFGTAKGGAHVTDYCRYCYVDGAFTNPTILHGDPGRARHAPHPGACHDARVTAEAQTVGGEHRHRLTDRHPLCQLPDSFPR